MTELKLLDPPGLLGDETASRGRLDRIWVAEAVAQLEADFTRSADTHLLKLPAPHLEGVDLYLKDESTHPTGSLKHRLARSLFLYGLCNGDILRSTTIVEASSGSTAVSEAYFAQLLGLPFIAVVPEGTSQTKIREIERYGGRICFAAPADIYAKAERLGSAVNCHYMDQFTNAARVTDWRGNNNIAESLFQQMARERHPAPDWVIVGAGTGGTSATIGRYIRYRPEQFAVTRLCVPDPEGSVFYADWAGEPLPKAICSSRLEGVGRPRVEPSFYSALIDRMMKVHDAASIATCWWLEERLGRRFGGSTGLNVFAMLRLAEEMASAGEKGSLVSLICDDGARYTDTIYNPDWLEGEGLNLTPYLDRLRHLHGPSLTREAQ